VCALSSYVSGQGPLEGSQFFINGSFKYAASSLDHTAPNSETVVNSEPEMTWKKKGLM
jgi:hypothetical protein